MQCEKCNSENTQRLQVAYENGTQHVESTSHTTGTGIGGGGFGLGGASTTTSGTSQSLLAAKSAPPGKRRYLFPVFFAFLAWLMWTASTRFSLWFFISVGVMALCGYLIYSAFQFNSNVWPKQIAFWRNQWLCHRCGHIYHVE